jgi:ATP-dependent DNA ligase
MPFVKPQLARTFKKGIDEWMWTDPDIVEEEKFDGYRVHVQSDQFMSRTGKPIEYPYRLGFPTAPKLDGELIIRPGLGIPQGHSEVTHWLCEDPSVLQLVLFDCLNDCDGVDITCCPWSFRRRSLDKLFSWCAEMDGKTVLSKLVRIDKKKFYDDLIERGGEGVMLKNVNSVYSPGSRSAWVKVKAWDPIDLVITNCFAKPSEWRVKPGDVDKQTGWILPEGDHTASWKADFVGLTYGFYDENGELRSVGSTGVTGPIEEMRQYVGRVASFKTYGRVNKTGTLNHPVFLEWRDDKDPKDCRFDFSNGEMM